KLLFLKSISTTSSVFIHWSIVTAKIAKPTAIQDLQFDGTEKIGVFGDVGYTLSGTAAATAPGEYTATATLNSGYRWNDGSSAPVTIKWKINFANYQAHVSDYGWLKQVSDGELIGTTGKSKQMEAFKICISEDLPANSIQYRSHVANHGWESSYKVAGQQSGTTGESNAVEAVQIKLSDNLASSYDI
ncbi:MAG: hypothetical protein HUJ62_07440, partial [Streptococcus gallolyticus]|nr:hypothetical protein [Streptococcus gallolyticus]